MKTLQMVASREIGIPFYRGIGPQRGRGFHALAQVFGRTAIPFLLNFIVPAAKLIGADLLEFANPEIADVVSGRKSFKTAARIVGRKTLRKELGNSIKKKNASGFNPTKSAKQNRQSIAKRFFCKHSALIMSYSFQYQPFVAVSRNLGGKAQ